MFVVIVKVVIKHFNQWNLNEIDTFALIMNISSEQSTVVTLPQTSVLAYNKSIHN